MSTFGSCALAGDMPRRYWAGQTVMSECWHLALAKHSTIAPQSDKMSWTKLDGNWKKNGVSIRFPIERDGETGAILNHCGEG